MPKPIRRAHRLAVELLNIEKFFDSFLAKTKEPRFKDEKRYKDLVAHRTKILDEYKVEAIKEPERGIK